MDFSGHHLSLSTSPAVFLAYFVLFKPSPALTELVITSLLQFIYLKYYLIVNRKLSFKCQRAQNKMSELSWQK